ncbi:GNAT family protein [soil metagenome]
MIRLERKVNPMTQERIVYLRPVERSDLPLLANWTNDPAHNSEYNTFGFQPTGRLEEEFGKNGLLDRRGGALLVVERETESVAGSVSYHQVAYGPDEGSQAYNIGITLSPDYRGKGYGSEAQRLFADYLFSTHTVMRIEASTDVANLAEQRALEKAGFTREGVARKAQWRAGAWHDLVVYSKLRGE